MRTVTTKKIIKAANIQDQYLFKKNHAVLVSAGLVELLITAFCELLCFLCGTRKITSLISYQMYFKT
jgi:hypothetical protein